MCVAAQEGVEGEARDRERERGLASEVIGLGLWNWWGRLGLGAGPVGRAPAGPWPTGAAAGLPLTLLLVYCPKNKKPQTILSRKLYNSFFTTSRKFIDRTVALARYY